MASNRVTHFESPADKPETLTKFYSQLFGWKFQKADLPGPEYWMAETGSGDGINGAIMKKQNPQHPWMNYVTVPSIDQMLESAQKLGAEVALPKTEVPEMGYYAAFVDPQGNMCGLWETK